MIFSIFLSIWFLIGLYIVWYYYIVATNPNEFEGTLPDYIIDLIQTQFPIIALMAFLLGPLNFLKFKK